MDSSKKVKIPFTPEDDSIIIGCIRNNPTNLKGAFLEASNLIGKKFENIQNRYYRNIKNNIDIFSLKVTKNAIKKEKLNVKNANPVIIEKPVQNSMIPVMPNEVLEYIIKTLTVASKKKLLKQLVEELV